MIIEEVQKMKWEKWLERPFYAFTLSLFEDSTRKESFEKIGIPDVELEVQLFQDGSWYINQESLEKMDSKIEVYLMTHKMIDITRSLESFKIESEKTINEIISSNMLLEEKFSKVFEILKICCTYIWLAHGIESYYYRELKIEVPKYVKSDIDTFIGDASFPKKKNAHSYLDEALRSGVEAKIIADTFGWMKARDGFSDGFTIVEIERMRSELGPMKDRAIVAIPSELVSLFEEIQELVFYRTERTDVFYYLFFKARPILQAIADKHNISFVDLKYYRAKDFTRSVASRFVPLVSFVYLKGEVIFQNGPIIIDKKIEETKEVKGSIAFKGCVRGVVCVLTTIDELDNVKIGDILVTQMTFPSFIPAMNRAAAFVTDEGGITCHAAIVAREMQKPCIIGTKIATKVFKTGDMVEVDAEKGIIRLL